MREIKFRGLAGNVWRYGDYETHCFGGQVSQICTKNKAHYKVGDTVGQYTGYKDEECTDIYEGDIVEFIDYKFGDVDYNCVGEVIFEDGAWHVTNSITVSELDNYDGGAIRVIGNIYENKELLEGDHSE